MNGSGGGSSSMGLNNGINKVRKPVPFTICEDGDDDDVVVLVVANAATGFALDAGKGLAL